MERLGQLRIADPDSRIEFLVKHYCYEDVVDLRYVCFVLAITDHVQTIW